MAEHPIIFSGDMVRAILEGRKTMTRRVVKIKDGDYFNTNRIECGDMSGAEDLPPGLAYGFSSEQHSYKCPYGAPGHTLWVRETLIRQYKDGGYPLYGGYYAYYKIDGQQVLVGGPGINDGVEWKWKNPVLSSRFMPRWASRITLEVVEVRVERVQEISHQDALSEGINPEAPYNDYGTGSKYRDTFAELWDSINTKRGYGWDVNPWVWVIEFRRAT